MVETIEPPCLGVNLRDLAILIGESQMASGHNHHHSPRMVVHLRLFVGTVVNANHLHAIIFKLQFVMRRLHFERILGQCEVRRQTH